MLAVEYCDSDVVLLQLEEKLFEILIFKVWVRNHSWFRHESQYGRWVAAVSARYILGYFRANRNCL
jgi:hypothetical protein